MSDRTIATTLSYIKFKGLQTVQSVYILPNSRNLPKIALITGIEIDDQYP